MDGSRMRPRGIAKNEQTQDIMTNQRTPGNGAVTLRFHVQRLRRAVPECER